ncbi:hypothetical protein ERJ75_000119800 [Trypanosoma vivax]|nr:hypothetical protein ERJ75_001588800 [Trypanosoma vivax]KAH8619826.1 hypothetical protein ERJ75_000119800 [Trypanosoma vivax]
MSCAPFAADQSASTYVKDEGEAVPHPRARGRQGDKRPAHHLDPDSCTATCSAASNPEVGEVVDGVPHNRRRFASGGARPAADRRTTRAKSMSDSFLLYLTRSAAGHTTERTAMVGESPATCRDAALASIPQQPSEDTLLSAHIDSWIEKMVSYHRRIAGLLSENGDATFGFEGSAQLSELLGGIEASVLKVCAALREARTNLGTYCGVIEAAMKEAYESEQRLDHLLADVEDRVNSSRESLTRVATQLRNERAAVKTILLRSGDQHADEAATWVPLGAVEGDLPATASIAMQSSEEVKGETESNDKPPVVQKQASESTETPPSPCVCHLIAQLPAHEMANEVLHIKRQISLMMGIRDRCFPMQKTTCKDPSEANRDPQEWTGGGNPF